eukprot:14826259-Ditylum_brightwellii.AAC.1
MVVHNHMHDAFPILQPSNRNTFTIEPLISTFGEYAEKPAGEKVRNGTLEIDQLEVNNITKEFLRKLQCNKNGPQEIDTTISHQDIRCNYKHWDKATSTSPCGWYLILCKT